MIIFNEGTSEIFVTFVSFCERSEVRAFVLWIPFDGVSD
jgi:hypothetical protein